MAISQISVFVENRPGRLADITAVLAKNSIDIRALSVADTSDYGILRLIVNDPKSAVEALRSEGMTASATQVLGIIIPDEPGGLARAIKVLSDAQISVEYAYAFIPRLRSATPMLSSESKITTRLPRYSRARESSSLSRTISSRSKDFLTPLIKKSGAFYFKRQD